MLIFFFRLQKFKNVGIMQRLKSIAYTKITPSDNKFNPMNVQGIVTILSILGIGMILSVVILAFEITTNYRLKNRNIRNRIVVTKTLILKYEKPDV